MERHPWPPVFRAGSPFPMHIKSSGSQFVTALDRSYTAAAPDPFKALLKLLFNIAVSATIRFYFLFLVTD